MPKYVFSLVGDSNVGRNLSRMSRRASSSIKNCQFISCGSLELFQTSLAQVRSESNVCIVSCVTNFLTGASGADQTSKRVDPILQQILSILQESCQSKPSVSFMLSPPMYRTNPIWYRDGLPEILSLFSSSFKEDRPKNLHLLSSFATPEFEADGVHLTSFSGLEFIVNLFDVSEETLARLKKSPASRSDISTEQTRVLEDRVMVLEQDHRRLNKVVEKKSAVDAELADYRENERLEDSFVISGIPALPSSLTGKEWQAQAVASVKKVILQLMGREMDVVVVQNITSRQKDAETTFNVKMSSIDDSRAIRKKFGSFFAGSKDGRPAAFKNISIKNRVTSDTRIRISILKLMAKRYKDSNPGSKVQVIGYDPRPLLKIVPPAGSSDRRTKIFNYVEACRRLPSTFDSADLDPILRRVNPSLRGEVKATFIVLSDDMLRPQPSGSKSTPVSPEDEADIEMSDARRGTRRSATSPPGSPSASKRPEI
jgi:hypothetical protein